MNAPTTIAGPQCMRALKRANEVRLARAKLKRRIADGNISAAAVILNCPEELQGLPVAELLLSQHRWGSIRCRRLLTAVPLPETKTIGSMTERQRHALATLLEEPEPAAASPRY